MLSLLKFGKRNNYRRGFEEGDGLTSSFHCVAEFGFEFLGEFQSSKLNLCPRCERVLAFRDINVRPDFIDT